MMLNEQRETIGETRTAALVCSRSGAGSLVRRQPRGNSWLYWYYRAGQGFRSAVRAEDEAARRCRPTLPLTTHTRPIGRAKSPRSTVQLLTAMQL